MLKHECVSLRKLQQIASGTALMNHLVPVPREWIAKLYYAKDAKIQPIVKRCESGTLWVDKYYVAYQIDDGDVHYTYIAKAHLIEEVKSYREAARTRNSEIALPEDIRRCFRIARQNMRATGRPYWIDEPWAKMDE